MSTYAIMPDGIRVIDYDDSIAAAVADMWNKSGSGWGGTFGDGVWDAEKVINDHKGQSFFKVFIAMDGDEAVGYCSFDRYYKDPDTAYVHLLNVRPDYHGRKVGKALVLECVKETIARGLPRVDIHTWPGNTKAVPLYKKCGFLWEDRTDTTHLCNMIPTVLQTELFKGFFAHADWYADSTRVIEVKPDGVKTNRFECFGYSWASEGETLRVVFEKTGRRIQLAETDDWSLEMMADDHELAFGFDYGVTFKAVNKTGKPLNIKIRGKDDGVISFPFAADADVTDSWEVSGRFSVGEINDVFDNMRLHPCVLADVVVNGKTAVFGLGIEPKFPLSITTNQKCGVARVGREYDLHIGIQSALPADAQVSVKLPDNAICALSRHEFEFDTQPMRCVGDCVKATVKECGYAALPAECEIRLADGRTARYTHMLHIIHQGMESAFEFETEFGRGIANGLWKVALDKRNNCVTVSRVTKAGWVYLTNPQLGQPYDEEFNIIRASEYRSSFVGTNAVFEADFASGKFNGAVVTLICTLSAAGVFTVRYRVTNAGASPRELWLKTESYSGIGRRTVFYMGGRYHELTDDLLYGVDALRPDCLEEPWVFNREPGNTCGVTWHKDYKPTVRWGDGVKFEHSTGSLAPGGSFATEPVVFVMGLFTEAHEFRNYVMAGSETELPRTVKHLEVKLNGGNPIVGGDTLPLSVLSDRNQEWGGYVEVSSRDGAFGAERHDNPEGAMIENAFSLPLTATPGVHVADTSMRFKGYEIDAESAFIVPNATIKVTTERRDNVLVVTNGAVEFKSDPTFADNVFSLTFEGRDWFFSQYPDGSPYSWWNPFIGGLTARLDRMRDSLVLRERIEAEFACARDNFGNEWTGICSTVTIEKFDEHRGFVMNHYFVTLPGVPVMCCFTRVCNNTGRYREIGLNQTAFLSGKERLASITASVTADDKQTYRLRMGSEDFGKRYDRLAVAEYDGADARGEKLHVFKDAARDRGEISAGGDINHSSIDCHCHMNIPNGGSATTKPMFFLFSDKTLSLEALSALENILF